MDLAQTHLGSNGLRALHHPFLKSPGLCGSALFGKFYVLNNVENESLQTSVYVCLTFEAYQL